MKRIYIVVFMLLIVLTTALSRDFESGLYDFNKMDLVVEGCIAYAFDFGPSTAVVAHGYEKVTDETIFDADKRYGWLKTDDLVSKETITLQGAQVKDFVGSSEEGIFRVLLEPGVYNLTFLFNDVSNRPSINLLINFEPFLENWFLPALMMKVFTTEFEVPDGILEIRFKARSDIWIINALIIAKEA